MLIREFVDMLSKKFKIVLFDFDGTVTQGSFSDVLSPVFLELVRALHEEKKGLVLGIASYNVKTNISNLIQQHLSHVAHLHVATPSSVRITDLERARLKWDKNVLWQKLMPPLGYMVDVHPSEVLVVDDSARVLRQARKRLQVQTLRVGSSASGLTETDLLSFLIQKPVVWPEWRRLVVRPRQISQQDKHDQRMVCKRTPGGQLYVVDSQTNGLVHLDHSVSKLASVPDIEIVYCA